MPVGSIDAGNTGRRAHGQGITRAAARTVQIRAGAQLLNVQDPIPDDLLDVLTRITGLDDAH